MAHGRHQHRAGGAYSLLPLALLLQEPRQACNGEKGSNVQFLQMQKSFIYSGHIFVPHAFSVSQKKATGFLFGLHPPVFVGQLEATRLIDQDHLLRSKRFLHLPHHSQKALPRLPLFFERTSVPKLQCE